MAEKVARNFEPLKSCGKDSLSYTAKSCVSHQTFISFEETQFSFSLTEFCLSLCDAELSVSGYLGCYFHLVTRVLNNILDLYLI